ncbi:MAG: trypsin-like peptidase domain-containing protein [Clostridium sp.]|nr:trypsin-like peptidase domain-containing protein [Clostridium sp.]
MEKGKSIKDVKWEKIEDESSYKKGKIEFRNRDKKPIFIKVSKGILFMLTAIVSGGISGAYFSQRMYSQLNIMNNSPSVIQGSKVSSDYSGKFENNVQNSITRVVGQVSQSVVDVYNTDDDNGSEINNGSGIILKEDGYIVTNYHIIANSKKHFVKISNIRSSKPYEAKLIGYDAATDIAVLKINADNLPAVTLGDSSKVQIGQYAIAIGNPTGKQFQSSAAAGIISVNNQKMQPLGNTGNTIQSDNISYNILKTDASINPSMSGGALCNLNGEVIGINCNAQGMEYAVSINDAKSVINSIMKYGRVIRPYFGAQTEEYIANDKDNEKGVKIENVVNNSGASKAGLKQNDIIVEFDSIKLESNEELQDIILRHKVGDSIPVKILRDGKTIKLHVILTEASQS